MWIRIRAILCVILGCTSWVVGQPTPGGANQAVGGQSEAKLGVGDQISVWARDVEEISNRSYRIEENGEIRFPLIGRMTAAGLTVKELETALLSSLKPLILEPDVHVSVTEFRSHPVSVLGAVHQPGMIQLRDRTTLVQVLSMAGGLATDAGHTVKISRKKEFGRIPLPSAQDDLAGEFSVAEEDLTNVLDGTNPAANLTIRPHDVISVTREELIYVIGEVKRAGGFVLGRREKEISVLQALAKAEGLTRTAAPKKAIILRPVPGAARKGIEINLEQVMKGKSEDVRLRHNDILFVPDNTNRIKSFAVQAAQAVAAITIGVTVVRAGR